MGRLQAESGFRKSLKVRWVPVSAVPWLIALLCSTLSGCGRPIGVDQTRPRLDAGNSDTVADAMPAHEVDAVPVLENPESTWSTPPEYEDRICALCSISLETQASGSLLPVEGNTFLGGAVLFGHIVYALNEVGLGRVVFSGDTNILNQENTDCPLWQWLGGTETELPRVISVGGFNCGDSTDCCTSPMDTYPYLDYVGETLPDRDATDLRQDCDVIVYCAFHTDLLPGEAQTLVEFVLGGGGLYLGSEYFYGLGPRYLELLEAQVNAIARPLGAEFQPTILDWGEATGSAWLDCDPL